MWRMDVAVENAFRPLVIVWNYNKSIQSSQLISQYLKNKTVIHYFKQKLTANGMMVILFCLTNKNLIAQGNICPFRGNAHELSHEQVP